MLKCTVKLGNLKQYRLLIKEEDKGVKAGMEVFVLICLGATDIMPMVHWYTLYIIIPAIKGLRETVTGFAFPIGALT